MEVEREVSAATPEDGALVAKTGPSTAERLRQITEERELWINKRRDRLERKNRLLKLLERGNAKELTKKAGGSENLAGNTKKDAEVATEKDESSTSVVAARKKELKELQERAIIAVEKQKQVASAIARNLKQLNAKNEAQLGTTERPSMRKRKRDDDAITEQPAKKVATEADSIASIPEMPPFIIAPDLDVGTSELAAATCFRIAMRHLALTGMTISKQNLDEAFKVYTNKVLDEVMDKQVLDRSLVRDNDDYDSGNCILWHSHRPERWQPARQFLETSTFSSSSGERILALLQLEKQTVADACDSMLRTNGSGCSGLRRKVTSLSSLLCDDVATSDTLTLSTILAASVGVVACKPTDICGKRVIYGSYREMSGVFAEMESWLRDQADTHVSSNDKPYKVNLKSGAPSGTPSLVLKYTKPFSLGEDSVVKQLRRVTSPLHGAGKKLDPMKVLCHYELNGVCNDSNCSFYHKKDYEVAVDNIHKIASNATVIGDGANALESKEIQQLLHTFVEFRSRIATKWPAITSDQRSSTVTETSTGVQAPALTAYNDTNGAIPATQKAPSDHGNGNQDVQMDCDFLDLDIDAEDAKTLLGVGNMRSSARYYDKVDATKAYIETLQNEVEKCPNDANAWLLLAINQLEFDTGKSDDVLSSSYADRTQQQLVILCRVLNMKQLGNSCRELNIEEGSLRQCLHTLSRAVEVEANAYCEALWLLYLQLCGLLTGEQTEIDIVEQAVQFLPRSHVLWLRYVSTYAFDSVKTIKAVHWRILHHLANVEAVENDCSVTESVGNAELSTLLMAICFHLCVKLWRAGEEHQVGQLLATLLQSGDSCSDYEWCDVVRSRLRTYEMIKLYLVFAHVLVFNEVPALVEHWVYANSSDEFPVEELAYSAESLEHSWNSKENDCLERALGVYQLAFRSFENDCCDFREAGDVILNNWVLLISHHNDKNLAKGNEIKTFFQEKQHILQQYPAASLTAARIMDAKLDDRHQAEQLMLATIQQSSEDEFPRALHHFLFARRHFSLLVNSLDEMFPKIIGRLANLLDMETEKVAKAIQDINDGPNLITKSIMLKALLSDLLSAWMSQLASLAQGLTQHQSTDSPTSTVADIYVALDICHLMDIMLEPSIAVDSLQMMLTSSKFESLSIKNRQLIWFQRFLFQVDLLRREDSESSPWSEHKANLKQLFRRYLSGMSVEAEMVRQMTRQIEDAMSRNAIQDAVYTCLYPERRQMITYDANLKVFRLCSAAFAGPEKVSFFVSCTDTLSLSPSFSISFSDIAFHEWELIAARASLRKCLAGPKSPSVPNPQVLQALVAVELRLRNMKMVSSLLESALQLDPLLLETWRLILSLEILFGGIEPDREKKIAIDMEKRNLVLACNTFGDAGLLKRSPLTWNTAAVSMDLRGLSLRCVPNSVLLLTELVSLDLSGNELTELPTGLKQLKGLRKLNLSENAFVDLPASINRLTNLKELKLAHNNLTAIPLDVLSTLQDLEVVDIRWNALTNIPASIIGTLKKLKLLRAEGNSIPADELQAISQQLSSRRDEMSVEPQAPAQIERARSSYQECISLESTPGTSPSHSGAGDTEGASIADSVAPEDIELVSSREDANSESEPNENNIIHIMAQNNIIMDTPKVLTGEGRRNGATMSESEEGGGFQIVDEADTTEGDKSTLKSSKDDDRNEGDSEAVSRDGDKGQIMVQDDVVVIDAAETQSSKDTDNSVEPPVTEALDSGELSEQGGLEGSAVIDQTRQISSIDLTTTANSDELSVDNLSEAFVHTHADAISAAVARRRISHDDPQITLKKLASYMEKNQIANRAEVRQQNPELWHEFVTASLPLNAQLGPCRLCRSPNDGRNQRFNSTVLCVNCLKDALELLEMRVDESASS